MIGCWKAVTRDAGPSGRQTVVHPRTQETTKTTKQQNRTEPSLDYSRLDSERKEGRKSDPREPSPRRMTVIVDWHTYRALLRFQADNDFYKGPGHAIGQLCKAKLADLGYLFEKSPLEDVETTYKRTLREQAEHARASEIYNIRDSWSTLSDKAKRFWLDRYPELSDLPAPVTNTPR